MKPVATCTCTYMVESMSVTINPGIAQECNTQFVLSYIGRYTDVPWSFYGQVCTLGKHICGTRLHCTGRAQAQACSAKLVCLSAGRVCTRICLDVSVSNLWEGSDLFALALEVKMTGYLCGPLDDGQKAIDPGNPSLSAWREVGRAWHHCWASCASFFQDRGSPTDDGGSGISEGGGADPGGGHEKPRTKKTKGEKRRKISDIQKPWCFGISGVICQV